MKLATYDISFPVDKDLLQGEVRDDLTVMVAGQGGDGSLTIIALLSKGIVATWLPYLPNQQYRLAHQGRTCGSPDAGVDRTPR